MTTCTILVKNDKSLVLSGSAVIRQGSGTDQIQILIPIILDNISLSYSSCTVVMRYLNNAENRNHTIVAQPDVEIYKDNYIRYTIPTESLFTGSDGFTNISGLNKIDIIIKINDYPAEGDLTKITTGECEIEIIPSVFPLNTNEQGGGGGTSDYTDLSNKPQINGHTLVGNQSSSDLGIGNMIYSVEEQVVGTWINGKPMYQKTFEVPIENDEVVVPIGTAIDFATVLTAITWVESTRFTIFEYGDLKIATVPDIEDETKNTMTMSYVGALPKDANVTAYVTLCYTKTEDSVR